MSYICIYSEKLPQYDFFLFILMTKYFRQQPDSLRNLIDMFFFLFSIHLEMSGQYRQDCLNASVSVLESTVCTAEICPY